VVRHGIWDPTTFHQLDAIRQHPIVGLTLAKRASDLD
jgi:hypothetical protein